MNRIFKYIAFVLLILWVGCDVHEFPEVKDTTKPPGNTQLPPGPDVSINPDNGNTGDNGDTGENDTGDQQNPDPTKATLHIMLNYETSMTQWDHVYDGTKVVETGLGETYENTCEGGQIRYVVRVCPVSPERGTISEGAAEFVFVKDVSAGYDAELTVNVVPDNYNVMVWSDFSEGSELENTYTTSDFSGILQNEEHLGNSEHNDAFRGTTMISMSADLENNPVDTVYVTMNRPLAKFEFIANDLPEFINKIAGGIQTKTGTSVDTDDYKVRFYYVGFKPDVYSMHTDKPVDASIGVTFESTMSMLENSEVKIGFDYVFVGDNASAVTLQVGVYDNNDKQISLTEPIKVPLMRDRHTILTGAFLTPDASKGVQINPDYDGDHNWILP